MTAPTPLPAWISDPHFDTPVLVTGLPRSGTSMVAGLLAIGGLWLGRTARGSAENIHGFFENTKLREKVQKEILRRYGFDPNGVRRLPPPDWRLVIDKFRPIVATMIAAQGYDGSSNWGFKDAKMILTWRIWQQHFPKARWVAVRRPPEDVIASCLRTSFMKQHSTDPAYWRVFVEEYESRLAVLRRNVAWSQEIEAAPIVAGDFTSLRRLTGELGLEWRPDLVQKFVAPQAWRRGA